MNESIDLLVIADKLLASAGICTEVLGITPCVRGGNNRTFCVETKYGKFALKQYFRQPTDTRDRLNAEFNFLAYAHPIAPTMTPQPYANDESVGAALYEFIEGKPLQSSEVNNEAVDHAAAFFCLLNEPVKKVQASKLAAASEACFSIADHLTLVRNRIEALSAITLELPVDQSAAELIVRLSSRFEAIAKQLLATMQETSLNDELSINDRCISPSDFGFHNALRTPDGSIRFIDFEYAGWDDPAKMVGDFFSQLALPVPLHYFERFTDVVMRPFANHAALARRAESLRPIYQIKWCCIALNVFIPLHLERRKFANPNLNVAELKQAQLTKANLLVQQIGV